MDCFGWLHKPSRRCRKEANQRGKKFIPSQHEHQRAKLLDFSKVFNKKETNFKDLQNSSLFFLVSEQTLNFKTRKKLFLFSKKQSSDQTDKQFQSVYHNKKTNFQAGIKLAQASQFSLPNNCRLLLNYRISQKSSTDRLTICLYSFIKLFCLQILRILLRIQS